MPTHLGAAVIAGLGLFVGVLLAQLAVRIIDISGGTALLLEFVILVGWTAWIWAALPDRFFQMPGANPHDEPEPWIDPKDRDDGRLTPEELERRERDRPAGRHGDPRDDPPA